MPMPTVSMSPALTALIERAVARVRQSLPVEQAWPGGEFDRQLAQVALASEFALDTLARQPALLQHLAQPDPPPLPLPQFDPAQPQLWPAQLRRYRSAESTRLVWRDVLGLDSVEATWPAQPSWPSTACNAACKRWSSSSTPATARSLLLTAACNAWWCSGWASWAAAS